MAALAVKPARLLATKPGREKAERDRRTHDD